MGGIVNHERLGTFRYGLDFNCHTNNIDRSGNIFIGDGVDICDGVKIFTHKHDYTLSREPRRKVRSKINVIDLTIGNDVFIGENALIIGITSIGDGAIIGAGSVVTKDVPSFEIWGGNPAKRVNVRQSI